MSNRKRFLALVLTIVMVFGTMATLSAPAMADFVDVPAANRDLRNAIGVLQDLEIARGIENPETGFIEFRGSQPVTREQFALFVARINTGTPEWFQPSEAALADLKAIFPDTDHDRGGTFASAILHCVDNGIISGRPDGLFHPKDTITFEEAIAMLVRTLGHTGLSFPQGYLSRAREGDIALIGEHVATPGFDFGGRALGSIVTRDDMAMLLYNFLMTNYRRVEMVWNGVTGRYESQIRHVPTISLFGITPIVGYITGVENFAMNMNVRDYSSILGVYMIADNTRRDDNPLILEGTAITERQARGLDQGGIIQNQFDIEIGFGVWAADAVAGTTAPAQTMEVSTGMRVGPPPAADPIGWMTDAQRVAGIPNNPALASWTDIGGWWFEQRVTPGGGATPTDIVINVPTNIRVGTPPTTPTAGFINPADAPSNWVQRGGWWFETVSIPGTASATAPGAGWRAEYLRTTKEALNIETPDYIPEFMANRYWLGKKVIVFARTTGTRRETRLPSATVIGTRTLTDNTLHSAPNLYIGNRPNVTGVPHRFVNDVRELRLDDGLGNVSTFNQREGGRVGRYTDRRDLSLRYNLYAFTRNGRLVADGGNANTRSNLAGPGVTDAVANAQVRAGTHQGILTGIGRIDIYENSIERQLAAMIANNGHYELWFIDNGVNRRGEREFFYEFIPYHVGMFAGPGSRVQMRGQRATGYGDSIVGNRYGWAAVDNNASGDARLRPDGSARVRAAHAGITPVKDRVYLYTAFGWHYMDVVLKEELVPVASNVAILGVSQGLGSGADLRTVVGFSMTAFPQTTFNYATGSRVASRYDRHWVSSGIFAHTANNVFRANERYTIFAHPDDSTALANRTILFAQRTAEAPSVPRTVQYAVVINTNPHLGGANSPNSGAPLGNTAPTAAAGSPAGIGYSIQVFNAHNNRMETVVLRNADNASTALLHNIRAGEYLALTPNADGSFSWAPVTSTVVAGAALTQLGHADALSATQTGLAQLGDALRLGGTNAAIREQSYAFEARSLEDLTGLIGPFDRAIGAASITPDNRIVADATVSTAGITDTTTRQAVIANDTQFIIFGTHAGGSNATWDGDWTARRLTGAQLATVRDMLALSYRVAVITRPGYGVGVADVVFISTFAAVPLAPEAIMGEFAVVTHDFGTGGWIGGFGVGRAAVLGQTETIPVYAPTGNHVIRAGTLVRLTGTTSLMDSWFGFPAGTRANQVVLVDDILSRHSAPGTSTIGFAAPGTTGGANQWADGFWGDLTSAGNRAGRLAVADSLRDLVPFTSLANGIWRVAGGRIADYNPNARTFRVANLTAGQTHFTVPGTGRIIAPIINISRVRNTGERDITWEIGSINVRDDEGLPLRMDNRYGRQFNTVIWYNDAGTPIAMIIIRLDDRGPDPGW